MAYTPQTWTNGAGGATPLSAARLGVMEAGIAAAVVQGDLVCNVKDHGVVGDGVTNDTAALRTILAAGHKTYLFPPGTYLVQLAEGTNIGSWTSQNNIRIFGYGATIQDATTYSADTLTPIFLFDGCTDVEVTGFRYVGQAVPDPATQLGYRGATFVRAINGTRNVKIDANLQHCRYGLQTGEYDDQTKGNCKTFDVRLTTSFVGYPIAAYLAEDVNARIYAADVHRAAYLAGVTSATVDVNFKNQYIADTAVLLTDAKTGTGTSNGCRNIRANVTDLGSTIMEDASTCAGIGLSRVDPGTVFSDIDITVNVKGTDSIATTMGGFRIASDATTAQPSYPFDWEQTIYLRNIRVSGIVDRSTQTATSNTAGDLYVNTVDTGTHYATVSNLTFENLTIIPSSGNIRNCVLAAPGLADKAIFRNFIARNQDITLQSNNTSEIVFEHSVVRALKSGGTTKLALMDTVATSWDDSVSVNGTSVNSSISGGGPLFKTKQTTLTLSGATTTWTNAIPIGAVVLGLSGIVTTAITGATGYTIGPSGDAARYVNTNSTSLGTTFTPANQAVAEIGPRAYTSTTSLIVTAKTSNFTGGQLKLSLAYLDFPALTS